MGVGNMGEEGQKVQISSCQVNKSRRCKVNISL